MFSGWAPKADLRLDVPKIDTVIYRVKPRARGKYRTISGTKASNRSTATMAERNGSSGRTNFSIGRPLMAIPTNSQSPTGGVMCPIAEATTQTMPKWIGCTPTALATGNSTGTVTRMISDGVRKVPSTT